MFLIIVFIFQLFMPNFTESFILNENSWNEPWRFLTAMFLHGSIGHLVLNLFALLLFGSILEKFIGGNRMLGVFLLTGLLANLIGVNFYSSSLGASGAIFGVIGALIIIRPLMPVWAFGMPLPIFVAGILWIGADLLGAYGFFIGNPIDNAGNIAHLSGILFGFAFGWFYRRKINRRNKKRTRVIIEENSMRNWEDNYLR